MTMAHLTLSRSACLLRRSLGSYANSRFFSSKPIHATSVDTDEHGIPRRPTWSVNELLTSYAKPTITPSTLRRLHELSALVAPDEGTQEHEVLTRDMENMVKLVEAVKLVNVGDAAVQSSPDTVPDGRIWDQGTGIDLRAAVTTAEVDTISHGRALLRQAAQTENGLYIVEADRNK